MGLDSAIVGFCNLPWTQATVFHLLCKYQIEKFVALYLGDPRIDPSMVDQNGVMLD